MKRDKMKQAKKKSKEPIRKSGSKGKKPAGQRVAASKKSAELRVLILDDTPADAELMERLLRKEGIGLISQRVNTRSGFLQALKTFKPDLILADYSLPKFNALQALALRKKNAPLTPFIVVAGSISEEIAVECMKQGADDYLLKDRLARLGEAVRHSLANHRLQAEKMAAEEALHEMNEIFRFFLKHNPIYVFFKDKNIRSLYLSDNYEKLLGHPISELLGKSMDELFPSEISRTMIEDDKRILREGITGEFIEELNGRIYSTIKFPIFIMGKPKYLAGYTMDITERKKMEDELKDSESRYHNLFENSSEFIYTLDLKGNFTDVNKAALSLTGYTKSELLKMNFKNYTPKRDHRKLFLALSNIYKTGKPLQNLLIEAIIKDKSKKYFETSISLMKKGEQIIGFQGSSKDITERKQAEEQIRASLLEKEVLLKEIHHRVKNNLQIISGLLTLQAAQINDERLQRLIKESQSRIWTMALIHQTLYQSGNLADIDMADYIRSLAGNLLSSHAQVAMPPTVSFNLVPVRLVIDKAIPLALIINELVTNAMKHAFADGQPGEIRISLQECRGVKFYATAENMDTYTSSDKSRLVTTENIGTIPTDGENVPTYELTVADNGVGLPVGFDPKNQKSLGLQLVTMLVKQLGGQLAIESRGGTSVCIIFSSNEKNEKQP